MAEIAMSVFAGLHVCVSGKFSKSQQEMKDLITDNGGTVASTVNAKCAYLVASEVGTSKYNAALAKGVQIVTEEWVDEAIESGSLPTDPKLFLSGGGGGAGSKAAKPKAKKAAKKKSDDMDEGSDDDYEPKAKAERKTAGRKRKATADPEDDEDDDGGSGSGGAVFAGLTFCVSGKMSRSQGDVEKLIVANGGKVAGSVTKAVTHVVSESIGTGKTVKAVDTGVPVVREAFLDEAIKTGALPTDAKFFMSQPASGGAAGAGAGAGAKAAKPAKKSAAPPAKRRKVDKDDDDDEEEEADDDDAEDDDENDKPKPKSKEPAAETKKKVIVKGKAPVDDKCKLASSAHVYEEGSTVWDARLNQTNIANNNNKFYTIQLLESDAGGKYYVWNRWGRVGATGQSALHEPGSLAAAKKEFEKKFSDKTKNKWADRTNFKPVKGKYTLLEMDYSGGAEEEPEEEEGGKAAKVEKKKDVPESKLDPRVQDLVKLICDLNMMKKQMIEIGYDAKKLPLGRLSKKTIQGGFEALKKIEKELNDKKSSKLVDLSNEFYTLIPHEFGMQRPPVINNAKMLKEKLQMVEALADIEIAQRLLDSGGADQNPIDHHFNKLQCGIEPVSKKSEDWDLLAKYVKNTRGHTQGHTHYTLEILDAFHLDRGSGAEAKRFAPHADNHNRMLLWHGSRLTNFVGILSQGLRIAPPEAPVTGYMFGKGVYFADMVTKSANYCFTNKDNYVGLLLLCEVALGDMNELYQADYYAAELAKAKGKHSTFGKGSNGPDPKGAVKLKNGCVVPCGVNTPQQVPPGAALLYNEFIVYSTEQIQMKYLVQVRFNYH